MHFSAIGRYLAKTGAIAVLGTAAIIISVPFVRVHLIRWQTARATLTLEAGQPAEAVRRLRRVQAWADLYPAKGMDARLALIRAYVQLGDMEKASALAQRIATTPVKAGAVAPKTPACLRSAESAVNRLYCRLDEIIAVHSARDEISPAADTNAGFLVIRQELYRLGRSDLLPAQKNPAPGILLAPPTPPTRPAPDDPAPVADNVATAAAPAEPQETAPATNEPPDKSAELAARKEALKTELDRLRKELAQRTKNDDDPALQHARKQVETAQRAYRDFIEQGNLIKRKMDAASGEDRMIWLDQLRIRKGEEIRLRNALDAARKTHGALAGNSGAGDTEKIRSRISRLEEELKQTEAPPAAPST